MESGTSRVRHLGEKKKYWYSSREVNLFPERLLESVLRSTSEAKRDLDKDKSGVDDRVPPQAG